MSTAKPTLIQIDPSQRSASSSGRQVLAQGQLDSENCVLVNDTDNTYIVFMLHDDDWMAELWAQPPGANVAITPTWKVGIFPANCNDAVTGSRGGYPQTYWSCWGLTTQAGETFYFSRMST